MPLSASILEGLLQPEIKTQVEALYTISDPTQLDHFATALATAIANKVVSHIVSSALVTGAVTSGSGIGGTVTGTVS